MNGLYGNNVLCFHYSHHLWKTFKLQTALNLRNRKKFVYLFCCNSTSAHQLTSPNNGSRLEQESVLHRPVLLQEVVDLARSTRAPQTVFVDCTVGAGGHFEKIAELGLFSHCIAVDRDKENEKLLKSKLSLSRSNFRFIHGRFSEIDLILQQESIEKVGFILADLGVSSMHLDNASRGFSFMKDGPLDMRMDQSGGITAYKIVNEYREEELGRIIRDFGEERKWRRIAAGIVHARKKQPIETTQQFANIICTAKGEHKRYSKIHPATLTFQALRLYVNQELNELTAFIPKALSCLSCSGRLVIISFHSLEDRIVKLAFKEKSSTGLFKILTKKPVIPSETEQGMNPRSRSAKLRAIEHIASSIDAKGIERLTTI